MATEKSKSTQDEVAFTIQRIYVKDMSFEAPNAPEIFRMEWKPEVKVDLQTHTAPLETNVFEVVLKITVTVTVAEKVAFLIEVQEAGIFTIQGFPEDQRNHALGAMCPGILFPYAREAISDVATRGGFPQLLLAPVNFDGIYLQHLEQLHQQEEAAKKGKK